MRIKNLACYLLAIFFFANCDQQAKEQRAENDEDIPVASMADMGIDSVVINKIDTAITGDQNILFDKTNGLLVVINTGNYNKWDIQNSGYILLKNYVYPALIKK